VLRAAGCRAQQCSPSAILARRPFASLSATADSSSVTACVFTASVVSWRMNMNVCVCVCGNAEHSRRGTQSDPGVSTRTQVDVRRHAHLVRTVRDHCTRLARVLRQMNDSESRVTSVHSTSVRVLAALWTICLHCRRWSTCRISRSRLSPVHDVMFLIRDVLGLPFLLLPGRPTVPWMISFSEQSPLFRTTCPKYLNFLALMCGNGQS